MDDVFIADGYTLNTTIAAVPGLHGEARVAYRPALAKERLVYQSKLATNPDAFEAYLVELVAKHTVAINDAPVLGDKERAKRLHPTVRVQLIDLILSYTAARDEEAAKN